MTYNILLIKSNDGNSLEHEKHILKEVGRKFSRSFVFDTCDISASPNEIINKAKSAHAVLLDGKMPALRTICKELGLYASVRFIDNRLIVNDSFGGIYDCEKGFRNNPAFGREAYDTECYSELEIERVARIAYELSPTRHITLIDKADELATSKLWRKIVTDINEDYPFVSVDMESVEKATYALMQTTDPDTILTSHLFADIICGVLSAKYAISNSHLGSTKQSTSNEVTDDNSSNAIWQNKSNEVAALLGDTTLGMYIINTKSRAANSIIEANSQSRCNKVAEVVAVAFMLRHSFDMQTEADYIERENV